MATLSLTDDGGRFDVTQLDPAHTSRVVLFAVGGGGSPERHLPLLNALAEAGCTVVAPHFERLVAPIPTKAHLLLRAHRLRLALDSVARPGVRIVGLGHSIGATMLLALAGAVGSTIAREQLDIARDERLSRLALFAPATDFFRAPGALDDLVAPIVAWVGSNDSITAPTQALFLKEAPRARVEVRVIEGADHFSFMDVRPPRTAEPLADREAFFARLVSEVTACVTL
jgi:alpha-beta hydrolase superfamily lysophospholipase